MTLTADVARLAANIERINGLIEGDDSATITTQSGAIKPSISKAVADTSASALAAYYQDLLMYNSLTEALVVSDWKNQLIAHCSTLFADTKSEGGNLWLSHYASDASYTESIGEDMYCALLKINPCNLSDISRFTALSRGQTVGDWVQAVDIAPYDPTLIIEENQIQYIMVGQNGGSVTRGYCRRIFNKTTELFADTIEYCQIRYDYSGTTYVEEMTTANLNVMVARVLSLDNVDLGTYPILSGKIVESGGFYWGYLGSLQSSPYGFQGCIIKSADGLTWDYVSAPPLAVRTIWEGALEVVGDVVYLLLKADNRYRIYSYDIVGDTWFEGPQILGQILSRPFLFYYNSKLYAMYNGAPNNVTPWGTVFRSCLAISVIDQTTLAIIDTQKVMTDAGCHYFSMTESKGTLFMSYTEDRRKHDITQMKGNISVTPVRFLNV